MTEEWDLVFAAFACVRLHARYVLRDEESPNWPTGSAAAAHFLLLRLGPSTGRVRLRRSGQGAIRRGYPANCGRWRPPYWRMINAGVDAPLRTAAFGLTDFASQLDTEHPLLPHIERRASMRGYLVKTRSSSCPVSALSSRRQHDQDWAVT